MFPWCATPPASPFSMSARFRISPNASVPSKHCFRPSKGSRTSLHPVRRFSSRSPWRTSEFAGDRWISDNLHEMLGYVPDDAYYADWWVENVHPQERESLLAEIQEHLFSEGYAASEYRFRHHDGNYRWTRFEIRLVRDTSGEKMEAVGSWSDITERKRLENLFANHRRWKRSGRLAVSPTTSTTS